MFVKVPEKNQKVEIVSKPKSQEIQVEIPNTCRKRENSYQISQENYENEFYNENNEQPKNSVRRSRPLNFSCKICGCLKTCSHDLKRHCFAVHNYCPDCDLNLINKDSTLNHMRTEHQLKVNCEICDYTSPDTNLIKRHMQKNHGITIPKKSNSKSQPVKCKICQTSKPRQCDLNKHYRFIHNFCGQCGLQFDSKLDLAEHLEKKHDFDYLKCDLCLFVGLSNYQIRNHIAEKHPDENNIEDNIIYDSDLSDNEDNETIVKIEVLDT